MRELAKIETVMTYEEWERIYKKRSQKAKEIRNYYIAQKSLGILLIMLGVTSTYILSDATAGIFFVPLGIGLLFTKDKVIN